MHDEEDYWPMGDGKRWKYSTELCSEDNCNKGERTSLIDGQEVFGGKKYFKFVSILSKASDQEIVYMRKAKEGIYLHAISKDKSESEALILPIPSTIGKKWNLVSHESGLSLEIIAKEALYLPDKKYENCLKVSLKAKYTEGELKGIESDGFVYYAPDIGLVKSLTKVPPDRTYSETLIEYKP